MLCMSNHECSFGNDFDHKIWVFYYQFQCSYSLYYTQILVGNPPRPYHLDMDTGSDLTWIQCDAPCTSCAKVLPNCSCFYLEFFFLLLETNHSR